MRICGICTCGSHDLDQEKRLLSTSQVCNFFVFFFFLSRIKELFPFLIDHILNVFAIKDK